MAHIQPIDPERAAAYEERFAGVRQRMGFVPNSLYTLGHRPEILETFMAFSGTVLGKGTVSQELKQLAALMASTSAGCRYCQAHTSSTAARVGRTEARVDALPEFETSDLFSDAERAVLRLARDAGIQPNAATAEHFAELRKHYSEEQIVELMATIALFGFLNRWNDSVATDLEDEPVAFASEHLSNRGWTPGKHRDGS